MDALSVLNRGTGGNSDYISESNAQIVTNYTVAVDLDIFTLIVSEDDANGVASLLAFKENGITTEEAKFFHLGGAEGNDGVVIICCVINYETIRGLLLVHDGCGIVGFGLFIILLGRWCVGRAGAIIRVGHDGENVGWGGNDGKAKKVGR